MPRPLLPLLAALLTACPPPVGTPDETDTDTDVDTDTQAPPPTFQVQASFDGAAGSRWRVAAFRVRVADGGASDFLEVVGEEVSARLDDGPVELDLPEPTAFDPIFGDALGAAWLIAAYDDTDGNGLRGEGESTEAISRTFVLWLDEETALDGVTLPGGEPFGLRIQPGVPPEVVVFDAPLPLRAIPVQTGTNASGAIRIELLRDVSGMSSALQNPGDPIYANAPIEQPFLTRSFAIVLSSPLHPSRQVAFAPDLPLPIAIERPVAYDDADESGAFSAGDPVRAWACRGDVPFAFAHLPRALDPVQAQLADALGLPRGWAPVELAPEAPPRPLAQPPTDLSFDPRGDCATVWEE